ncbi:leptin [Eublepharis macularius]|uniref:Leptin n=1 Tax=Eublepharis macularius TaxID=481883 RepID=A0AA97L7S1_EUBMA|nr:leptin [Eublepharis macularius]
MGAPGISARGLLCLWLAFLCGRRVEADLSSDIKVLSEITISRVQQFPELSLKISGLEFIPERPPAARLGAIDQALERFQQVLGQLLGQAPAAQVSNDVENLRSLLRRLAARLGCALHTPSSRGDLGDLRDRLADSSFTVVSVTFDRLRELLRFIQEHVDDVRSCY